MNNRALIRLDAQLAATFSFVSRPKGWFRTNDGAAFLLDWLREQGWIVELRGMAVGEHFRTAKYEPIPNMTWICLTSRPVTAPYEHGDNAFGESAPVAVALLVQRLLQRRGELPIDDKPARSLSTPTEGGGA